MQIHPARETHLESICRIANWAIRHTASSFQTHDDSIAQWRDRWEQERDRYPWFVAVDVDEDDGTGERIVAFCRSTPFGGRCSTPETAETSIYVLGDHQRRGIARALYAATIEALRAGGFRSVVARIMSPNPASERLHAAIGFRHVGTVQQAGRKHDRWYDVAYWQLMLNDTAQDAPIAAEQRASAEHTRPSNMTV